jgi:hypothetical protein
MATIVVLAGTYEIIHSGWRGGELTLADPDPASGMVGVLLSSDPPVPSSFKGTILRNEVLRNDDAGSADMALASLALSCLTHQSGLHLMEDANRRPESFYASMTAAGGCFCLFELNFSRAT